MNWQEYKQAIKEAIGAGDLDKAESLLVQAINLLRSQAAQEERICVCLDQLAWIHISQKTFKDAKARYLEALEIKRNALGESNVIVGRAYKKLATVSYMMENYPDAERYGKEALNILKATLGMENEETRQTLADMVALLRRLNRTVEADILEKSTETPTLASRKQAAQTFFQITVCKACDMPYDGPACPRCA